MLEKHIIQTRGFHNTVDADGNITGFQFEIRSRYYKGLWPSQIRIGDVIVDGDVYSRDMQTWTISGLEHTPDEMLEIGDSQENTYWQVHDTAVIKVKKPGGLSQGYHDVCAKFGWVCNYIPPIMYRNSDLGINFEGFDNTRTLLIV